jgi:hypothetical protein
MRRAVVLLSVAIAACASAGTTRVRAVDPYPAEEVSGQMEHRPGTSLTTLPESATYAWVLPSEIYLRTRPADSAAMLSAEGVALRESFETVLRGSGWEEVPRGAQQFEVTAWVRRRRVQYKSVLSIREELVLGIRRADGAGAYWRVPLANVERHPNEVIVELVKTLMLSRCGPSRCDEVTSLRGSPSAHSPSSGTVLQSVGPR